jgi:hypothetical protein
MGGGVWQDRAPRPHLELAPRVLDYAVRSRSASR